MPKTPQLEYSEFLHNAATLMRGKRTMPELLTEALELGLGEMLMNAIGERRDNLHGATTAHDSYRPILGRMFGAPDPDDARPVIRVRDIEQELEQRFAALALDDAQDRHPLARYIAGLLTKPNPPKPPQHRPDARQQQSRKPVP